MKNRILILSIGLLLFSQCKKNIVSATHVRHYYYEIKTNAKGKLDSYFSVGNGRNEIGAYRYYADSIISIEINRPNKDKLTTIFRRLNYVNWLHIADTWPHGSVGPYLYFSCRWYEGIYANNYPARVYDGVGTIGKINRSSRFYNLIWEGNNIVRFTTQRYGGIKYFVNNTPQSDLNYFLPDRDFYFKNQFFIRETSNYYYGGSSLADSAFVRFEYILDSENRLIDKIKREYTKSDFIKYETHTHFKYIN